MRGFDPAFGCQFSTYAVPKIAGEIRRFLRDDGAVKVSRGLKERAGAIRSARERLSARLGREPALSELAEETGLEPEEIAAAEEANLPVASLQMETGDGFTLESVLGTEGMEEAIVEREALRGAVAALPERERQVILLRYFRGMTQDRTAKVLGVSQVQVSRIERKAVEHLRRKLILFLFHHAASRYFDSYMQPPSGSRSSAQRASMACSVAMRFPSVSVSRCA